MRFNRSIGNKEQPKVSTLPGGSLFPLFSFLLPSATLPTTSLPSFAANSSQWLAVIMSRQKAACNETHERAAETVGTSRPVALSCGPLALGCTRSGRPECALLGRLFHAARSQPAQVYNYNGVCLRPIRVRVIRGPFCNLLFLTYCRPTISGSLPESCTRPTASRDRFL